MDTGKEHCASTDIGNCHWPHLYTKCSPGWALPTLYFVIKSLFLDYSGGELCSKSSLVYMQSSQLADTQLTILIVFEMHMFCKHLDIA